MVLYNEVKVCALIMGKPVPVAKCEHGFRQMTAISEVRTELSLT